MQKQRLKRGKSSVATLHLVTSKTSEMLGTDIALNGTFESWNPKKACLLKSSPTALDTWKMSQAMSILGPKASMEKVRELMLQDGMTMRSPVTSETAAPSRFARALQALRLAVGSVLLGMGLSSCAQPRFQPDAQVEPFTPYGRHYDADYGVVCYWFSSGISCVQVRQGTRP